MDSKKDRFSNLSRRDFLKYAGLSVSAAAAARVLAACAPQAAATPTAAPAAAATTGPDLSGPIGGKLVVWGWANPWLKAASELYKKQHPDVTFEFVDLSYQDTHQKFAVAASAGTGAPDVLSIDSAQLQNLVYTGGLLNIAKAMAPHMQDFPQYKLDEASDKNGGIFAVPWDVGPISLFYNKKIFDGEGIEPPKTWDEYITVGQKMLPKGHFMLAHSLSSPNPQDVALFQKLLWQAGGSYFDKATGAITLDNAAGLKAMDMYTKIIFSGITTDISPFTPAHFGAWKEGKLLTEVGAGWMLHVFMDNIKEGEPTYGDWRIADYLPAYEAGGTPTSNLGGSTLAVSVQTKNAATAVDYAMFTCASVDSQVTMGNMGTFPSFYPAYKDDRFLNATAGVYGDQKFNQPFINLAPKVPTTYWRDRAWAQAEMIVNAGLVNIHEKKWTGPDGLKNIANNLRSALLRA
jgi:ABC-type glycerol-3-phosphate transport system substrate-binding protein